MKEITPSMGGTILYRVVKNYLTNRPLAVSFEITHSCTANCRHCDKGGKINEVLATPEDFRQIYDQIQPLIAQISGGEPLLRKDVLDVVKALKKPGLIPYIVLVTNGSLLTVEKYLQLKEAGVNEFAISLDFPDERHDANRRISGLYQHLNHLIPRLSAFGNRDITLVTAITSENLPYLSDLAKKAQEWNVLINFSAYTMLRTRDKSLLISSKKDVVLFHQAVTDLIRMKRKNGHILTTEYVLRRSVEYFRNNGFIPHCKAGRRSLVVNPDGSLSPCAMKPIRFRTQRELIRNFSKGNRCGGCYVSLRANTDKSIWQLLKDVSSTYFSVIRQQATA